MAFDRREFLKKATLGAGALGFGSALSHNSIVSAITKDQTWSLQGEETVDWEKIDADHEEKVRIFLDRVGTDELFWNRRIEPTMDGDVKVFELTCTEIQWATEEDNHRPAFAYNGMVPGPEIRVTEGDHVRIHLHNEMGQSTAVHWHGLDVPNDQDGVPFVTQPPIRPGESYTYEFIVPNPGSHMYHSHHNSLEQVVGGLLGAFVVEPLDKRNEPVVDQEYIMILNDTFLGFTINGRSYPYTQPLVASVGERIRIRYYNEGLMIHPMHLHGMPQKVIAKDGYDFPAPYYCDTLNIAPGERYDVIVEARAKGIWAFHCHILNHVEDRSGLFGMVTPFVITD